MPWHETDDGLVLAIRLTPKGRRDRIDGLVEVDSRKMIKARVSAPPVSGAANSALIKLLSKSLKVPKSQIRFVSGETGRVKRVLVKGNAADLIKSLQLLLS